MHIKTNFKSLRPILYTEKMEETIEFYTSILGFVLSVKSDAWQWASLAKDGIEIMLSQPNQHTAFSKPVFTGSFYIVVDDVDATWDAVREKAKICYEPATFEWGMREFAVYDNNAYLLQFGQEV